MKKIISFLSLSFLFFLLTAPLVSAQLLNSTNGVVKSMSDQTQQAASYGGMSNVKFGVIAATIIQAFLGLLGIIFLVLVIIAGFKWMTAAGNEEQIKKSQATIKNSVIGIIIIITAYAITYYVFNSLPFNGGSAMPNPNISQ